MTTIKRELGSSMSFENVVEALKLAFSEVFDIKLVKDELSREEIDLASRLRREKYSTKEWIFDRPSSWKEA